MMNCTARNYRANVYTAELAVGRMTWRGKPLSHRDSILMVRVLAMRTALCHDLLRCDSAHIAWERSICSSLDLEKYARTFKWALGWLRAFPSTYLDNLDYSQGGPCRNLQDFKHLVRAQGLYWGLLSPFYTCIDRFIRNCSVEEFRILTQWFAFDSHITLRDVDLSKETVLEYQRLEVEMSEWEYNSGTTSQIAAIMRNWFRGITFASLTPFHGPGATATVRRGTGRAVKYDHMYHDQRLLYFIRKDCPDVADSLPPLFWSARDIEFRRTSVLQCVPKSMTSNRTISMEPTALQFYQHGVNRILDDWIRNHPELREHIDLHDQSKSQRLAWLGSCAGKWATIDMSSASDTITLPFMKACLRGTPLLRPLLCLRSDFTKLPDGSVMKLIKYAPMGSSLCFSSMCIIFSAICELASQRCGRSQVGKSLYQVYGDDIAIHEDLVPCLRELLDELHFKVNWSKSYVDKSLHNFREACGGEYFDGFEVTPLRASRRLCGSAPNDTSHGAVPSVEYVSSYVSMLNQAFERGFVRLRGVILWLMTSDHIPWKKFPFRTTWEGEVARWQIDPFDLPRLTTSILTYPYCCTNFGVQQRWGRLHRTEYRCLVPTKETLRKVASSISVRNYDDVRYWEYWISLPHRPAKVEAGVAILPEPLSGLYPERQKWCSSWVS